MKRILGRAPREKGGGCGGFTLIEIIAALAILGTALFVLLEANLGALNLCVDGQEEVKMRSLLQRAVAQAEIEVQTGKASGSGEFGKRYAGYSYAFEASPMGDTAPVSSGVGSVGQTVRLFEVLVKVEGPTESRAMSLLIYDKRAQ